MSWDLRLACADAPARVLVDEWAASMSLAFVANAIERADGDALFLIDGPDAIEADDLDDGLAAAVPTARWQLVLSVPLGTDAPDVRGLARSLARHVAERCGGAVFDPQADAMIFPAADDVPRAVSEPIETVELVWYATVKRGQDGALAFVQAAQHAFPPATPGRYGRSQPYASRLDPMQPGSFADAWRSAPGMLSWQSAPPCFGGAVMFPTQDRGAPVARLDLHVDRRALGDPPVRDGVVALFERVAIDLRALFACAAVRRGASTSRGRLWVDGATEKLDLPYTEWLGLPAIPTWLAWYGEPYVPLVTASLTGAAARDGALFVRASIDPADADALRATAPQLPDALLGSHADERRARTLPAW